MFALHDFIIHVQVYQKCDKKLYREGVFSAGISWDRIHRGEGGFGMRRSER